MTDGTTGANPSMDWDAGSNEKSSKVDEKRVTL
jgi:hypothetical protein